MPNLENCGKLYIKRVVAIPGDTILANSNIITIKNINYIKFYSFLGKESYVFSNRLSNAQEFFVLKKGEFFVMGDNIDNSIDSRYFGPIQELRIIGKPIFIYWSVDEENKNLRVNRIFNFIE